MRNLIFFICLMWSSSVCAQQTVTRFQAGSERYFSIDTNHYFLDLPYVRIKDTLAKLQKTAAGDYELLWSLKLYVYVREAGEHLVSNDVSEYRLVALATEASEKNLQKLEADARQALGDFYSNCNQQSAAIEQYNLAFSIYKNYSETEHPAKQRYLYQMGLMYYRYQDYTQAIKHLQDALRIKQTTPYSLFSQITNTIGLSFRSLKQYDSAVKYFKIVYDTAVIGNDGQWIGISQGNIGVCFFHQKRYKEAEPLLKRDIELSLANSGIRNAVTSMAILATIYNEQNKFDESEKLLLTALSHCYEKSFWSDYTIAENIYMQLYRVYRSKKKYQLSNLYADSALMAKDSVISKNNGLVLSRAYERQNFIKKKLAAEKLQNETKQNQLRSFDQQQLLYKIIIGFLVVVLVVAFMVNRFRSNLKEIATNIQDAPEIVVQKMSIVIISIATCAASLVWTGLYYYYYGLCLTTFLPFVYFLLVGPSLIIYFFTKKQQLLVNVQLFCIFFITLAIELVSGGFKGGVVIMWAFLAPVGALMYKGIRHAAIWMTLFIISILCLAIFHEYLSSAYYPIPETAQFMFDCMNILGPVIVIFFSMQFFVKSVIRDGRLLQQNNEVLSGTLGELKLEKQKSDDLLLNILPEEVANELKEKGSTTAKHFDNVTVLFTDFVNFTQAGENMSPQGLIDELHECFKMFDEITGKYNIEKIKTIGDAYLAVAGLPTADHKHAENVIRAATEINAFMQDRLAKMGSDRTFAIRIGIHSGSVVAGIVGVKKFAYDIWGDTVNTASRMESSGSVGKVNISETTYELVKDKFTCEYRGEVEAKGKGVMKMYYVSSAIASRRSAN
jgi:class 3 adenylate cyclase/tetratricopeptide (TPR) repeat protein